VTDPSLRGRLDEVLDLLLADDVLAWTLAADGTWTKVPTERGVNTQQRLQELAAERTLGS
jgi:polyphosphate kinase